MVVNTILFERKVSIFILFIFTGIGRDLAKQLALCGAEVIAVSRSTNLLGKNSLYSFLCMNYFATHRQLRVIS